MKLTKKLLGHCGVDSGQILLTDPCYIESEWKKQGKKKLDFENKKSKGKFSYEGCCIETLKKETKGGQLNYKLGHAGAGVVCSSGYGDGTYPVYAYYNEEGRIMKVEIKFN